jgi:hypothetical protein
MQRRDYHARLNQATLGHRCLELTYGVYDGGRRTRGGRPRARGIHRPSALIPELHTPLWSALGRRILAITRQDRFERIQ